METRGNLSEYQVRESARAKHVRFRMTPSDGLLVIVPPGFDRRRIPELVLGKQEWIEWAAIRVEEQRDHLERSLSRPDRIFLRAIDASWAIDWIPEDASRTVVEAKKERLQIRGHVEHPPVWRDTLRNWLTGTAETHLIPWIEELAFDWGVTLCRTIIRCQKTRWGSYSARGTVSLNSQLLFLPPDLVRYVLHHELCHATHPDHSPAFWERLRRVEPEAEALRRRLRGGWSHVPGWLAAPHLAALRPGPAAATARERV